MLRLLGEGSFAKAGLWGGGSGWGHRGGGFAFWVRVQASASPFRHMVEANILCHSQLGESPFGVPFLAFYGDPSQIHWLSRLSR